MTLRRQRLILAALLDVFLRGFIKLNAVVLSNKMWNFNFSLIICVEDIKVLILHFVPYFWYDDEA